VMRTNEAVTRADSLEIGFAVLVVVYAGLAVAVAWLLRRLARRPPATEVAGPVEAAG
jgi:cytochrome bd ubiquinol oxidase subunit I